MRVAYLILSVLILASARPAFAEEITCTPDDGLLGGVTCSAREAGGLRVLRPAPPEGGDPATPRLRHIRLADAPVPAATRVHRSYGAPKRAAPEPEPETAMRPLPMGRATYRVVRKPAGVKPLLSDRDFLVTSHGRPERQPCQDRIERLPDVRIGGRRYRVCYGDLMPLDPVSKVTLYDRIAVAAGRACGVFSGARWTALAARLCQGRAIDDAVQRTPLGRGSAASPLGAPLRLRRAHSRFRWR